MNGAKHQLVTSESPELLGDLLSDLMTQSSDLVKGEAALVKAELRDKARLYSSAALIVVIGGAIGLLAAMALLAGGIVALSTYTGLVASFLIFGTSLGVLAAFIVTEGIRIFRRHSA